MTDKIAFPPLPKGSPYSRKAGVRYKGSRYSHTAGSAPKSQYAHRAAPSVEEWAKEAGLIKEAPAKSKAQARFMAHYYESKPGLSKAEKEEKTEEWMAGSSHLPEKKAGIDTLVQHLCESYGIDLTTSSSLRFVPDLLKQAAGLTQDEVSPAIWSGATNMALSRDLDAGRPRPGAYAGHEYQPRVQAEPSRAGPLGAPSVIPSQGFGQQNLTTHGDTAPHAAMGSLQGPVRAYLQPPALPTLQAPPVAMAAGPVPKNQAAWSSESLQRLPNGQGIGYKPLGPSPDHVVGGGHLQASGSPAPHATWGDLRGNTSANLSPQQPPAAAPKPPGPGPSIPPPRSLATR